jgi:ABC-type transport system substrate-binding protein
MFILCHGYAGSDRRAQVSMDAGGMGLGVHFVPGPLFGRVAAGAGLFAGLALALGAVTADEPCNLVHGNYDVAMYAWVSGLDPVGSYNAYTCQGIPDEPPHQGQNNTRTCDPKVDEIWNTVKGSVDFAKIGAAMADWQKFYAENVVEIPLFMWKDVYLVSPKLQNVTGNPTTSGVLWNVQDWWLQP